jgi:hypothetical protein
VIDLIRFDDSPVRELKFHTAPMPQANAVEVVVSHAVKRAGEIVRIAGSPMVFQLPEPPESIVARIREAVEALLVHEVRDGMRYAGAKVLAPAL